MEFLRWLRASQSGMVAFGSCWSAFPSGEQSDAIDAAAVARQFGVERCVLLEDRLDMPELYMSMDLCVLPSYREGLPRCLLEAGAMGVAAAATDIRGCREVIVDGETGLLFPLKDVGGFAAVVERVLTDDSCARSAGPRGPTPRA